MLAALWLWTAGVAAHEMQLLRVEAGIDLFPSFLAADLDITSKSADDGSLALLIVYREDAHEAEHLAAAVAAVERIRGMPIRVEVVAVDALSGYQGPRPAGLFVADRLNGQGLAPVLAFGKRNRILVISPHKGDVEQGASGGISVSDRILPYVNVRALRGGGIRLKPFFMRIADKYGD